MTSDINAVDVVVVGLQGNPVSPASPTDGYTLTWDAADGYWVARPLPALGGLRKDYFTSNGTWTAPSGVTQVILMGSGGGGGGGGDWAHGGGGAQQAVAFVTVTPNAGYTVTIGAGGSGGASGATGGDGANTTFGSLFTAAGAGGGGSAAGTPGGQVPGTTGLATAGDVQLNFAGSGGHGNGATRRNGLSSILGFAGGTGTAQAAGGGGGPQGVGANAGFNAAGSSASANTGAGGGGGGNASAGGNGGSGYLYIIY